MRKILLFLLTLVTMMAQAQMEKTATFDFNHPSTLNPAVTPSPVALNEVGLNDYTFTANDVTLDFGAQSGWEYQMNVILTTNNDFSHSMGFNQRSTMIISVPSSSYITKIEMGIANINISPNVGTYNPATFTWTASNTSTSEVVFSNPHSYPPTIQTVTVYYVAPSAIMDYSSASIIDADNQSNWYSDGVDVTSFKSFDIDFPKNVSLLSSSGITMTDKNDANIPFTASCSGSKLSLTPNDPITEDDDITIYVPANVVQSSDNLQNKELGTFNFKVRKERETFNYTATDPEEGDVVELPKTIKVTFPKAATLVDDGSKPIKMYKDGDYQYSITLSQDPDNKAIIWLVNNDITGPITNTDANQGVWTIKIPAGLIHTTAYRANVLDTDDYWNEETTLTWTIIPTPDPLQPKKDRVAELQATATQLYAQIGQLGYPTADSGSPTLASVKDAAVADTDEALDTQITTLENAIKAFYAVTDVAMPSAKTSDTDEDHGWYAFYSVDANGSEKAIHYENGAVSFVGGATMFQVQSVSGSSVALMTVEGESLTVTLTKMLLTGAEADQSTVAGLFAVTGIDGVTCVRLEEGSKPQATLVYPTAFLLGESAQDNTKRLTLLVVGRDQDSDVTKVSLNGSATEDQQPYFAKRTGLDVGDKVTSFTGAAILTKSASYNNGFEVHLDGMESGDYWLIMPKGCFDYSANPKTVTELDDPLKVSFTIQGSGSGSGGGDDSGSGSGSGDDSGSGSGSSTDTSDFRYDLLYYTYPSARQEEPIKATDLNQAGVYILRAQYGDMCVDDTKTVTLSDYEGTKYRTGTLVRDDDFMAENPACSAYRVEWDTPLTEEDFPNSKMVSLKIPGATFGNANFGQWLANPNSVKKSDCIVNQGAPRYYTIDNARAEDAETAEDRAAFDTYKATKIAEADGKAELGQSQACADLIDNAKAAINNLVYDKTLNLAANKARVDAIITQLNADLSTQRAKEDALAAFVTHKNAQKAAAQAMAKADDSAASKALITNAVAAIEAVTYDEDKSLAENKAPIDAIITKLTTDLATQRAKDAAAEQLVKDKAAFAEYKVTQKAAADALGQEGDSDACKKLISDAKALIDGMTFDESKSLAMNKMPIDATIQKLATDLVAQRDIEKSKAALKALIDEAKAYAESIKTSHPAVATMLNGAIATAEAKYNEQTATKAEFDTAKDTLSVMLEAAKSASTGIFELTIPDSVKGDFYTLDGRKLDGKPTKKGVYIVNGRKVVIK